MIIIKANSIRAAWRDTVSQLYVSDSCGNIEKEVFKDDIALIQVRNVIDEDYYDDLFPMRKDEIDIINDYIITGKYEDKITHKWTKLYRERLFEEDNQIEHIIKYLKDNTSGRRAQVSVWKNIDDINAELPPCLQLLWFQIVEGRLDIHVHMRLGDCFGKLLMNMNEFASIQRYVAKRIGTKVGQYYHIIDSCHFCAKDKFRIDEVFKIISSEI